MKIPELFVTFIYSHQLVDLWDRQALRSKRLKKLNNGLTIAFLKPKYLTRRIIFSISPPSGAAWKKKTASQKNFTQRLTPVAFRRVNHTFLYLYSRDH
jgi:hypothetical protein